MKKFDLNLRQLIVGILYENNQPSLTRFLTLLFVNLFIFVTLYLVLTDKTWGHYSEFATLTAGGGAVTQIANKLVNSKYNSPDSRFPDKNPTPEVK